MAIDKQLRGETTMTSRATAKQTKTTGSKSKGEAMATSKKMSALDAAARVLSESKEPMRCPELIEAMASKCYWKSPGGKTPAATLYSALQREITLKKKESRFKQCGPGTFTLA
jgi:hypothetical protein